MTAGKAIRLSKVARELNVGTSTIVEFLSSKGHDVSSNPNTKLNSQQYESLLEKFQPDMLVKQKKERALVQAEKDRAELFGKDVGAPKSNDKKFIKDKPEEEIMVKSNMAAKESVPTQVQTSKEQVEDVVKNEEPAQPKETPVKEEKVSTPPVVAEEKRPEITKSETKAEQKAEEKKPEIVQEEKPKVEEAPKSEAPIVEEPKTEAPKTEEPKVEEVKAEEAPVKEKTEDVKEEVAPESDGKGGFKVLGKIDLTQVKSNKPSPKKRKDEPKAKDVAPKPTEEAKEIDKTVSDVVSKETSKTPVEGKSETTEEGAKAGGEENPDHKWEDKRVELKGLSVLGKIDVKQFEPKKKKPDPKIEAEKKKRKRKRITASKAVSSTDDRAKLTQASRDNQQKFGDRNTTSGPGQRSGGPGQRSGGPGQRSGGPGQRPGGPGGNQNDRKRKRGGSVEKAPVDDKQIQNQIKETLNRLTNKDAKGAKTKLKKRKKEILRQRAEEQQLQDEQSSKVLQVTEFITANELANLMDVTVTQVIMACMSLGMMVSINQRIDAETISLVADEFGYEVKFKDVEMDEPSLEEPNNEERVVERAPIVTIMGHVDHGKTSLLDFIRKTNVIGGEAGGITQHIGAYEVVLDNGKKISFLDTPGHEAFTAMRARGASVTDIVIIVVAADDRVMPQTKEAIAHAQAAGVPMIFAINKVDREASNPDFIKQQLSEQNILIEEWGGKYQSQDISAKTGLNVDALLEKVLFEAEMLELKADPDKRAVGAVIEATLDKGRGIVTTVLVQGGTLRIGDNILAGANYGKVKAMHNENGKRITEAGPSTPVQILGFDGAPTSGDKFYATKNEQEAKSFAGERSQLIREQGIRATKHITLAEIGRRIAVGNFKELKVIVKGDVDGSVEALSDSLLKLSTEEIQVSVIHKAVGQISESDVLLASASDAIIIGFQVRPSLNARNIADKEQIDIRLYSIIYDAIEELKAAMEGMLEPKTEEKIVANVEIREVFKISKVGAIAGCMVTSGKINRNNKVRIIREGVVRHTGEVGALKRFKDDVKEVNKGYECGIQIANFNDIEIGDVIEAYELVEVKRTL